MTDAPRIRAFLLALCLTVAPNALATEFSVLTYNVFMRSPTWFFCDGHDSRSQAIPAHLSGYDAVVLQEAFSHSHRNELVEALKSEYPFNSGVLGEGQLFPMNGGVIILSRWPILRSEKYQFKGCKGSDCMVSKGVIYTAIDKSDVTINLFGLHLQAQTGNAATRAKQLAQLGEFIEQQSVPADELLLVAGDFNIDYFTRDNDGEFDLLTRTLQLAFEENAPIPSYEKSTNTLVVDDVTERLDYVFHSTQHLQPLESENQVLLFRENGQDLSDHHAVAGRFNLGGNGK